MDKQSLQFLNDLLMTPSPSGHEVVASRLWRNYVRSFTSNETVDVMGNSSVEVKGTGGPRMMLAAHIDEIGLMVTRIGEDGLIRFRPIGGISPEVLPGQKVILLPDGGDEGRRIPGVICWNAYSRHSKEPPSIGSLYIDIGYQTGIEVKQFVTPGCPIVVDSTPLYFGDKRLAARALDDRLGVFIMTEVLRRYAEAPGAITLVGAATTMEEIGCIGASTVCWDKDIKGAIWIDLTYDTLLPDVEADTYGAHAVGGGPVIAVGSTMSKIMVQGLKETASHLQIPVQYEPCPGRSHTDGDSLFLSQGGLPQAGLFVTGRNVHSSVETVSLTDVEYSINLLVTFFRNLPSDIDFRPL
jgi:endoglucanase